MSDFGAELSTVTCHLSGLPMITNPCHCTNEVMRHHHHPYCTSLPAFTDFDIISSQAEVFSTLQYLRRHPSRGSLAWNIQAFAHQVSLTQAKGKHQPVSHSHKSNASQGNVLTCATRHVEHARYHGPRS